QPKAYPSAAWIPILVTTAEPQKQPNQQGKNVNQQNVNQRRSPDDAEREAREMVLSQILFSHSLERKCLEDVILRAAQMEQIVEKVRIQSPFHVIVHHFFHIIKFLPSFSGTPHI
ncbi:unnamed protein product, partial [Brassica oleracea var. botrytis]